MSTGETGHAESVQVVYDPSQITYGELLRVFFSVAHDPTELNRQGPDEGNAVPVVDLLRQRRAEAALPRPTSRNSIRRKSFRACDRDPGRARCRRFYPAEAYHQNYAALHPNQPYIMFNDAPKVEHLRHEFPDLYTGK